MAIGLKALNEMIETEDPRTVYDQYWAREGMTDEEKDLDFQHFSRAVVSNIQTINFGRTGKTTFFGALLFMSEKRKELQNVLSQSGIYLSREKKSAKIDELELLDMGEVLDAVRGDQDFMNMVGSLNLQLIVTATLSEEFEKLKTYSEGFDLLKKLDKIGSPAQSCICLDGFNSWLGSCFEKGGELKKGRKLPTKEMCAKIMKEMEKRGVPVNAKTYAILSNIFGADKAGLNCFLKENVGEHKLAYTAQNPYTSVDLFQVAGDFEACERIYKNVVEKKIGKGIQMFALWLRHSKTPEQDTKVFDNAYEAFGSELSRVFLESYLKKTLKDPERFANAVGNLYKGKFLGEMFTLETYDKVNYSPEQALKATKKLEEMYPDLAKGYEAFASDPTSKQNTKKYSGEFGTLMRVYDYLLYLSWELNESAYIAPTDLDEERPVEIHGDSDLAKNLIDLESVQEAGGICNTIFGNINPSERPFIGKLMS